MKLKKKKIDNAVINDKRQAKTRHFQHILTTALHSGPAPKCHGKSYAFSIFDTL